ncbi:MAG TPA: hypothetical protein DDX11_04405 [Candidatus Peribacter riflensis]|nr:hypothetical protein [Candidatus Peribacter riflensis]
MGEEKEREQKAPKGRESVASAPKGNKRLRMFPVQDEALAETGRFPLYWMHESHPSTTLRVTSFHSLHMLVTLLLGSKSDTEFAQKIVDTLKEFSVPSEIVVASAHKVPEKVAEIIAKLNADPQPQVIITVVGMSNGLGGVAAGSSVHPVLTCPPAQNLEEYQVDLHSSLRMPSDVPVMTVLHPKNAALAAVRILAEGNPELKKKVAERIEKIKAGY